MKSLVVMQLILITCKTIECYKILTLLYLANGSMRNFFDPILLELAKKGNTITVIASTPPTVHHSNIQEFEGLDIKKMIKSLPNPDFIDMRLKQTPMIVWNLRDKWVSDCHEFYKVPAVKKLLSGDEKYDLIFLNSYMNECTYGIAHHVNASTVMISPFPVQPWAAAVTGSPSPLSFVNHIYYVPESTMRVFDRIRNLYQFIYNSVLKYAYYVPAIEKVYQKYVPNAPGVNEIESNVSLVMGAGHFSFSPLRPIMPGIVDELAGIHCREPKPLTSEVSSLIKRNGVEEDFIYFSFGSIVQGHKLPRKYRDAFISAFSKMNMSVLWKWEVEYDGNEVKLPANIHMRKWFPQQDVLGHPKCKIFITHGGISSVTEALFHGVPVIGIPFFADQDWNLKQMERIGVGVKVELEHVTEELISNLLDRVNGERYQDSANSRSRLFRDRPLDALSNAVWWVEHVLKHGGADHLKSPARNLNLIQYYSIDIFAFLLFSIVFVFSILIMLMRLSIQAAVTKMKVGARVSKRSKKRN